MFNAAIINLETGIQEAGETADYRKLEDGVRVMQELALRLTGQGDRADAIKEAALHTFTVRDAASFRDAIAVINEDKAGGSYTITLTGSFQSDTVSFRGGGAAKTITLKGDASERIISNKEKTPLFNVVSSTLTLVLDANLTLDGNRKERRLVWLNGGALVMKAGSTLRGSVGGGVYVGGGSFTMNGGTISGNSVSSNFGSGGGVFVDGGSFTMNGGTISGNSVSDGYGGGVAIINGSFSMSGGTISGNSAPTAGGGVAIIIDGNFSMSGGTISGNSVSDGYGGGVYVSGGSFSMSGGTISGNSASSGYGGGVYVSGGRFVKTGGTIDATNRANMGKVVYGPGWKVRNSVAGPNVNLDSGKSGSAGGWEE
jgi:hypothetical protein